MSSVHVLALRCDRCGETAVVPAPIPPDYYGPQEYSIRQTATRGGPVLHWCLDCYKKVLDFGRGRDLST